MVWIFHCSSPFLWFWYKCPVNYTSWSMNAPNVSFSSPSSIFPSIRKPICPFHLICHKLKHCIFYEHNVSSVQAPLLCHIIMCSYCHFITITVLFTPDNGNGVSKTLCVWNTLQTINNAQHNICINIKNFNLCTTGVKYHISNYSSLTLPRNNYLCLATCAAISFIMHSVNKQARLRYINTSHVIYVYFPYMSILTYFTSTFLTLHFVNDVFSNLLTLDISPVLDHMSDMWNFGWQMNCRIFGNVWDMGRDNMCKTKK
jgi:hypothetical protein